MAFILKDKNKDKKLLFPTEEEEIQVKLLEDLGQIPAIGKFSKNSNGSQRMWEAFKVLHEDKERILVGSWRLRAALRIALAESREEEPLVNIGTTLKIEKLKNGAIVAVRNYQVEEATPF